MTGRRPTKRGLTLLLGSFALLLAAGTAQAGWLYVIAAGTLGLLASSLVAPHRLRGLELRLALPRRAQVGDPTPVHLTLRNGGRRRVRLVSVHAAVPGLKRGTWLCEGLGPGQEVSERISLRALRRGIYDGAGATVECAWPFGIARSRRAIAGLLRRQGGHAEARLIVVPRVSRISSSLTASSSPPDVSGVEAAAPTGTGIEFAGVREYRPGDPARAVHWRATARRDTLVVRELRDDASGRLVCALGGMDHGDAPDSSFEALVSAAASLVVDALDHGLHVTLACADPTRGARCIEPTGRVEALDWLAGVRPEDRVLEPIRAALAAGGRGTAVVILSSSAGRAGAELPSAVRTAAASGARPVVVLARAETWDRRIERHTSIEPGAMFEWASVRTIARGQDVGSCLEA